MLFFKHFFQRSQHIFLYGMLMAVMVFGLKWLQWKYLITDHSSEIYLGLIAVFFTVFGIWSARQLAKSGKRAAHEEAPLPANGFAADASALEQLRLTAREYDVLQLLSQGRSNAEIAEQLFLSVSTIKTHVSNLFVKMEVKSRTQAIEKARRLKITP